MIFKIYSGVCDSTLVNFIKMVKVQYDRVVSHFVLFICLLLWSCDVIVLVL